MPRAGRDGARRGSGMALTGRAAAAAVIGALIVLALRNVAALIVVDAVILAAIAADLLLAAPVRPLRLARAGDSRIRLGQAGEVTLTMDNPSTRSLRATVRDAWPPSTAPRPARVQVSVPPGGRARLATTLSPHRRGDFEAARVTVRS